MILFLVNTFPSNERAKDGAFNLRAAKQISVNKRLRIIHLRAWHPKRKLMDSYKIDGLDVSVFSFPLFSKTSPRIFSLQLLLYKKIFFFLNMNKLKEVHLIHSVGASFSGIVGSHVARKLGIKHIAQCIGSDINFNLPKLNQFLGVKGWDKHVDHFACNSNELAKAVKELYPIASAKVIYRGVDLSEFIFNPQKFQTFKDKIYFLFLGGLSYRAETPYGNNLKGGLTILKAWKQFIDTNSNINGKVELLFGGPEISKEMISKELKSEDLKLYALNIIGQIDKEKVKEYMQISHVVLVPSMAEGLPNIAMEAAASGCAIIATDVGGTHEVVLDDFNGKIIEAGNAEQLLDVLREISGNINQIKNMGINSRQYMQDKFDNKQFAKGYELLYNSLLNIN